MKGWEWGWLVEKKAWERKRGKAIKSMLNIYYIFNCI